MAIRVAATLRIADHIADGRCSARQIAGVAAANEDALGRLLAYLVTAEVLQQQDTDRYALTALGECLREGHPSGMRSALDIAGQLGRAELAFVHLLYSVRTGEAGFSRLYGRSFWDDLAADSERTASYDVQMGSDVASWARDIASAYDWGSLAHIVDVGGGNGTLLAALLVEYPTLRGTVLDQAATVTAARETLRAADLEHRSDVVAGSFFDPLPPGADGYVLSAILHDWDDDSARTILRRCAEAAAPRGRIFVIENTGSDGESPSTAMDLRMLAYYGARERGVAAISALAADSGLHTAAAHQAGNLSIVELEPAHRQGLETSRLTNPR